MRGLVFLFLFCTAMSHAQTNLVPNYSFEDGNCPDTGFISDIRVAVPWFPVCVSPDRFSPENCTLPAPYTWSNPYTFCYQTARTGNAFAGYFIG